MRTLVATGSSRRPYNPEMLTDLVQRAAPALVALALTALVVLMTWPLAANLDRAVTDPGDPYLNTFTIDWVAGSLARGSFDVFDSPLAYPARKSLAFTEHLIGIGVLAIPLYAAGVPPLTTYNILFLAGFVASGMAAWLLTWHITRSQSAAVVAAIAYAFVPYRMGQATHLQHVWSAWLPFALWTLLRLWESPTKRRAAMFTFAVVMLGLSNIHWLLFGGFALVVSAVVLASRSTDRRRFSFLTALSLVIAGVLLLPSLLPYRWVAHEYGMVRTARETLHYSATPSDWLVAPAYNRAWKEAALSHEPERRLFPGFMLIAGTAAALLGVRRFSRAVRFAVVVLGVWVVIGFLGSLGLRFPFHRFLFESVEAFQAIRVPARWAMVSYTAMAVLAGLATLLWRDRRRRATFAVLFCIAFLWEVRTFPIRWYLHPTETAEVYEWMRTLPRGGGVLELPINSLASEYEYTLGATIHRRPIVNGVSGFEPPFHRRISSLAHASPIPDQLISELEAANVKLIVVHADRLGDLEPSTVEFLRRNVAAGRLQTLGRFAHEYRGDFVFIVPPTTRKPDSLDARLTHRADRDSATLDLLAAGAFFPTQKPLVVLDFPPPAYRSVGGLLVSGWAMSPHGIRDVTVLFNNGLVERRAQLLPRPDVEKAYPGIPSSGFRLEFNIRPDEVWKKADLQVRVEDRAGRIALSPQIWFDWLPAGSEDPK